MANSNIKTTPVHIITFKGYEFDRTTTDWEIAKEKKRGNLRVHKGGLVFDFRHL
jgi:hypothetical protein